MIFGPGGLWTELLGRFEGYRKTEVRCESEEERRYRLLDFWKSHREFEAVREAFATEHERFSRLLASENIVDREQLLGMYYTDEPRRGEGDESVPA